MVACYRYNPTGISEPVSSQKDREQSIHLSLYRMLYEAAEDSAQCPTNMSILDRWPSLTEYQINKLFERLETEGRIRQMKTKNRRIVVIVETGKYTRLTQAGPFVQLAREFVGI